MAGFGAGKRGRESKAQQLDNALAEERLRIAALNRWHVATSLAIIVGERADSAEIARSAQSIAHLVFAAVDGIELHYDMDPAGYPLDEVFELLLGFVLAETRRLTGG